MVADAAEHDLLSHKSPVDDMNTSLNNFTSTYAQCPITANARICLSHFFESRFRNLDDKDLKNE
jgi:hypothetical protein